jgi:aryl-alcohol dehydrogenase-like predicted oxidoreductase
VKTIFDAVDESLGRFLVPSSSIYIDLVQVHRFDGPLVKEMMRTLRDVGGAEYEGEVGILVRVPCGRDRLLEMHYKAGIYG